MAGKHEPPSKRSFWFSLTASTLKVVVIIGAIVAGVVVLATSFERVVSPSTPTATATPGVAVTPDTGGGGGGGGQNTSDDQTGVSLGIYNGTDTSGLAKDVDKMLRGDAGYSVVELGNTSEPVDTTTIYFVKASDQGAADALAAMPDFSEADVLKLPAGTTVIPDGGSEGKISKDVQVAIFIGDDFAG